MTIDKETWDIHDISAQTYELIKKAARHEKMKIHDWVEVTLKNAAEESLNAEKIVQDPARLGALIRSIDKRLAHIENNPLHHGARVVSDGAKALGESAREMYDRVEARKWFDKSYETAMKACESLGQHFKIWWESRGNPVSTSENFVEPTKNDTATVVEETAVEEETPVKKKTQKAKQKSI